MKTSNWIKFIGIICILIGLQALMNNLGNILEPKWIERIKEVAEVPENIPEWYLIIAYTGVLVNTLYFVSGVSFLLKKKFSLNLIYIALTISILFMIIPCFVVKPYHSLFFVLLRPFIDLTLLIGVYRIRKYYYESPNKLISLYGEYTISPQLLKLGSILAILFLSIPVWIQSLWIYAFDTATTHSQSITIFNSYFPGFLHGYFNGLSLLFCILAIILSSICLNSLNGRSYKTLHKIIISIGILLLFLNLFQMM